MDNRRYVLMLFLLELALLDRQPEDVTPDFLQESAAAVKTADLVTDDDD